MKFEDIRSIEEGHRPKACLYWVGSRQALSAGDYDIDGSRSRFGQALVLAKGPYTTYRGECGTAARLMEGSRADKRLLVAVWAPTFTYTNAKRYKPNEWVVDVLQSGAILLDDAEFRLRVKLQKEDRKRHALARKAVAERREELAKAVAKGLGLNGLSEQVKVSVSDATRWEKQQPGWTPEVTIRLVLPPADLAGHLRTKKAREALEALVKLKDPVC